MLASNSLLVQQRACGAGAPIPAVASAGPSQRPLVAHIGAAERRHHRGRAPLRHVVCRGRGLGDDLLDFIEAGPKMRKWYGAPERMPADEGPPEDWEPPPEMDEDEDDEGDGSTILVLDAESPMGEQVVLQLILARADIKVCVRDPIAAKNAYGPYVTPITASDEESMKKALRGVGSVVIPGKAGVIPKVAKGAGVAHIVMLSAAGFSASGNVFSSLFDRELSMLRDPAREVSLASSGVRYTIVRAPSIADVPGGLSQLSICQGPADPDMPFPEAPVAREDLAGLVVAALMCPPAKGGRTLQMLNQGEGSPPDEWVSILSNLSEDEIPCAIP